MPTLPVPSNGGVRIKAEPGSSYNGQGLAPGIPPYGNNIARQRAAQNLQNKFGSSANLQVNQLQAQAAMGGVPPSQPQSSLPNIQLPAHYSEQQRKQILDEKRQLQQRQYQNVQQAQQRPDIKGSQLDGADEWASMVAQRRADAVLNPTIHLEADQTLREQVNQMSLAMEGGGLMLPLSEHSKHPQQLKRKAGQQGVDARSTPSQGRVQSSVASNIAQYDGLKESDDEQIKADPDLYDDEDAINSDLDDPEENIVEDERDDEGKRGQIMLCTYDKVQRVKNKWKCTLKDGVLTTGGRE
jgi:transcription initiation factor TFIIA large subunit